MTAPISIVPSSYTIHNLNIISSTKIHQKVNQVLRIFDILPPVTSAKADQDEETTTAIVDSAVTKSSDRAVVELKAKANVASKLISIVEILKRDLATREKERLGLMSAESAPEEQIVKQKGTRVEESRYNLYQYTRVTTTRIEVKPKQTPVEQKKKEEVPSKTLKQAKSVDKGATTDQTVAQVDETEAQGQKRKRPADSSQDSATAARSPSKKAKLDEQDEEEQRGLKDAETADAATETQGAKKDETNDHEEEDDEEFEEMRPKNTSANIKPGTDEKAGTKQERDVPVLTIYLSMTPVTELAAAYGEQTS